MSFAFGLLRWGAGDADSRHEGRERDQDCVFTSIVGAPPIQMPRVRCVIVELASDVELPFARGSEAQSGPRLVREFASVNGKMQIKALFGAISVAASYQGRAMVIHASE